MIQVEAKNVDKVIEKIHKLGAEIAKSKRPMESSLQILRDEQKQNFAQQGRIYGYWRPLTSATRRQRVKAGFGGARPILVRSGKLKNDFRVTKFDAEEGVIRNETKYAIYHQEGTKKMPARPIIGSTVKSRKAIGVTYANFISKVIASLFK